MVIVTRRHLAEAAARHQDAASEIAAWVTVVNSAKWTSFEEVRATFTDVDRVDGYLMFNLRHNRYRLITVVHFAKANTRGHVYIRSVLTHKEYDNRANWDRKYGS